jgi:hypothetical protein
VESSVSELFDVYSCYFPITFNAAKNDPYGVSGDDLKIQMRACLTCHEAIAPFTLSLLLEKLDADETHIKIDCLEGITACAKSVGGKALCALPEASALLADVWAALKKECVYSSSGSGGTALTEESKEALQSVPEAAGVRQRLLPGPGGRVLHPRPDRRPEGALPRALITGLSGRTQSA